MIHTTRLVAARHQANPKTGARASRSRRERRPDLINMGRPSKREGVKAAVIELHAQGGTTREIARAVGVSHMTVARYIRDADVKPTIAARAAALAASAPESGAPDDGLPHEPPEMIRRQIAEARKRSAAAERAGDYKSATQNATLEADLTNTLLRAERGKADDADVLRISRREIDETMAQVRARIKSIVDRPLLCEHCSRQLSMDFGTGRK